MRKNNFQITLEELLEAFCSSGRVLGGVWVVLATAKNKFWMAPKNKTIIEDPKNFQHDSKTSAKWFENYCIQDIQQPGL